MLDLNDWKTVNKLWDIWREEHPDKPTEEFYQFINKEYTYAKKFEQWLHEHGLVVVGDYGQKTLKIVNEERVVFFLLKYS